MHGSYTVRLLMYYVLNCYFPSVVHAWLGSLSMLGQQFQFQASIQLFCVVPQFFT